MRSSLFCPGCEAELLPIGNAPLVFSCPGAAEQPNADHVLARKLQDATAARISIGETNPFLRFRQFDHVYIQARAAGLSDEAFVAIVRRLDEAIKRVDGRGFTITPYKQQRALGATVGFVGKGGIWIKDETGNVSGSHKGRHLFAVLVYLEVLQALGLADVSAELVIASCGNAALAAAVLARAAERPLRVFIPEDAEEAVVAKIASLGAKIEVCPRQPGIKGDPTYHRFREAVRDGAIPFSCQGSDQALAVQGGKTLAWEMVFSDEPVPDRIVVQVGGGALASAVFSTFDEASELELLDDLPRMHAVQTRGCFPLVRAYERAVADLAAEYRLVLPEDHDTRAMLLRDQLWHRGIERFVRRVAKDRNRYMQPWDGVPHSIAHGILDDETYDWFAIVRAMLLSGGYPILVDDSDVSEALEMGRRETGIAVCPTGAASLAGVCVLTQKVNSALHQRVAALFTGHRRDSI